MRAYTGSGGRAPSGVQGQSPLWGVSGAKPLEAESSLAFGRPSDEANLHHFMNFAKSQLTKPHIFLELHTHKTPARLFFQPQGSSAAFLSIPAGTP